MGRSVLIRDMCAAIKKGFPNSRFREPIATAPKWLLALVGPAVGITRDVVQHNVGKCPQFNTAKIRNELGFQFHDVEVAIKDQVQAMLDKGLAKPF